MHVLKTVLIVLEVLLLFNLLIFVHELGHFLAARWRGLKVERFAVWFGKPIWKTKIGDVEYCLGSIPAGGYVSLPQMAPMDLIEGKAEDGEKKEPLPPISPTDKIIVAFAGPLFSFLLAIVFAVIVWVVGKPMEMDKTTTIGWVVPDGPAWKAGLRPGDSIIELDNKPVSQWAPPAQDSVMWRIIASEGTNVQVKFERMVGGKAEIHTVYPVAYRRTTKWYERPALRQLLLSAAHRSIVHDLATNSPAALAGLRRGDEIIALNGEKIFSYEAVAHAETNAAGQPQPLTLTIKRGTNNWTLPWCQRSRSSPRKPRPPSAF